MTVKLAVTGLVCLMVIGCAAIVMAAPVEKGLIGLWLFDDGSGKDLSGNGNDGTVDGGVKWTDGKFGKAMDVATSGQAMTISPSKSLDSIKDGITIAAWVMVNAVSDTGIRRDSCYLLEDQSTSETKPDAWSFRLWTPGLSPGLWGQAGLKMEEWHHLVATYDGKMMRLFVDGKLDTEEQYSGKVNVNANSLTIGKYSGETFIGAMDEVALYDRALTEDEVNILMGGWNTKLSVQPKCQFAITWGRIKAQ